MLVGGFLLWSQVIFDRTLEEHVQQLEEKRFKDAQHLEDTRAQRAERLENLRFVRERSSGDRQPRPFLRSDLTEQNLSSLQLEGSNFEGAILTRATFDRATVRNGNFGDAQIQGASFVFADIRNSKFEDAELRDVDMLFAKARYADFRNADLFAADLALADLRDADFYGAYLGSADLHLARLDRADLRGTFLTLTKVDVVCYDEPPKWPIDATPPPGLSLKDCKREQLMDFGNELGERGDPMGGILFACKTRLVCS